MLQQLLHHKIIAIVRGIHQDQANQVAQALYDGGIRFMEVTMNTPNALDIIGQWREKFADRNDVDRPHIGAGTVLNVEMAKQVISAGASFIITPNMDPETIKVGYAHGVPVWPGCMTPTEIVQAMNAGAEAVKIFPLASMGHAYIAELRGPLREIPMIATGGVNETNFEKYFAAGANAVGMGSQLMGSLNPHEIEARARHFYERARNC